MWRRLKEDRNQHYDDLTCPCWTDPKAMAKFKEQPKLCSCWMCCNQRKIDGPTMQELKASQAAKIDAKEANLVKAPR